MSAWLSRVRARARPRTLAAGVALIGALVAVAAAVAADALSQPEPDPSVVAAEAAPAAPDHSFAFAPLDGDVPAVLLAAGDIASCGSAGDEATADLLDHLDGVIATLGDNVYDRGTAAEFAACFEPSWGRHRARLRPAPGNHDFGTRGGAGYFAYFGAAAGEPGRGYYAYDLGAWRVLALNSQCGEAGGCHAGSPQERWLRADLAAHPTACTLAYWHHPRFSSGPHGGSEAVAPLWRALYEAGADLVLVGHDHLYERFAPQDPDGRPDPARGIRQLTVGTGGASHYLPRRPAANSEVRDGATFGVLRLELWAQGYGWSFVPAAGGTFRDAGAAACH